MQGVWYAESVVCKKKKVRGWEKGSSYFHACDWQSVVASRTRRASATLAYSNVMKIHCVPAKRSAVARVLG